MKKYFKDMDTETKIDIVMNIEELSNNAWQNCYENMMYLQEEEGNLMFGDKWYEYIEIHDHYSSFFLTLKDWQKFIDNLDKDYLCNSGLDLYEEIMKLYNEYQNIVLDTEENENRYDELENILEEKCSQLLDICDKQLHEYENYNEEDVKDTLRNDFECNGFYDDYYIIDDDKTKVYVDIAYTKTFE